MSSNAGLPSSSSVRQPTWSFKIQNFSTPQTYAAKSAVDTKGNHTASATSQTTAVASVRQEATHDGTTEQPNIRIVARKRRKLNQEEEEMKNQIAASVSANLEIDQILALHPDTDTPFQDEIDIVQRLLPYHIYQQPRHDLDKMRGLKGKGKVNETDSLQEEVKETKFALECHKRFRALEQRMKRTRLKSGQPTIPVDQAVLIERMLLETEQSDKSILERELSDTRSELDKVLRAQRLAKVSANRTASTTSNSTSNTMNGTNTATHYSYTAPTFNTTTTTSGYSNYYSSYTYPYAQSFISGMRYTTPTKTGSSSIPGASSFQSGAAQSTTSPSNSSANQTSTPAPPTTATTRPPPVSIPLQLPVTSLPALQSLGILPVPKTSLPADSSTHPAAVLLGASNNGTMLSLEINAALLQPPQMSGLAILLSSLVKMSGASSNSGLNTGQGSTTGGTAQGTQSTPDTGDKTAKGGSK